jgi:inward rectifier potassium channel
MPPGRPLPRPPAPPTLTAVRPRAITIKPPNANYEIRVIGAAPRPLRDFYHALLQVSWTAAFGIIAGTFLATNALFACGYVLTGGIAHARPGSFLDAFFFSVQTLGTIGYGAFYPESTAAQTLVVSESIAGLILTALATGLVFAKFSRSTARVVFTREVVISPMNGVPTLMFRLGNERGNRIVDAQLRVVLVRTERTSEGATFYRMLDLKLARERSLSLSRSWSVLHPITEESPLFGVTPEQLVAQETELQVLMVGLDDTSMQPVHALHQYLTHNIVWGARHADVLSETPDGAMVLDLRRFHDLEPTPATEAFPHSHSRAARR